MRKIRQRAKGLGGARWVAPRLKATVKNKGIKPIPKEPKEESGYETTRVVKKIKKEKNGDKLVFENRAEAGRRLANKLMRFKKEKPLVLAMPRGGVPIGYEIAAKLGCPLDIIVVKKIRSPANQELAIGAVAEGNISMIDEEAIKTFKTINGYIKKSLKDKAREARARMKLYKSRKWSKGYSPEVVIVVDDGLATGLSAKAALASATSIYNPQKLVYAGAVCSRESTRNLRTHADEIVCVMSPIDMQAVGNWYKNFHQVTDQEVLSFLEKAKDEYEKKQNGKKP